MKAWIEIALVAESLGVLVAMCVFDGYSLVVALGCVMATLVLLTWLTTHSEARNASQGQASEEILKTITARITNLEELRNKDSLRTIAR
jgi:hypothetical protein